MLSTLRQSVVMLNAVMLKVVASSKGLVVV
jgi:hypothetical protein